MIKNNLIHILFLGGLLFACQSTKDDSGLEDEKGKRPPSHHIEELTKIFDAHGGYEQWSRMKSLFYKKNDEVTVTNLKNRKIRVQSPGQTIGFDGENVWVSPDTVDASRARFYHNLYFYFYAMPFVVGDPGAYYEVLEPKEINGKIYNGVKVSYHEGVGDAPDDNYIVWSDPETAKMEWLMYTVTYRSGEASDRYRLIKYDQWRSLNGLYLPTTLKWYPYKNDSIGEQRSEVIFENMKISENAPKDEFFEMPENAQIARY